MSGAAMVWISVKDRLPDHGDAVLVRRIGDNWYCDHTLADGSKEKIWRWQACRFERGRTADEVAKSRYFTWPDQEGNNLVPYGWSEFGPGKLFGQDVSHWAHISNPIESGGHNDRE